MNPGLVVKLRPTGAWRIGPDSGARNRVETVYHSDSLYSAVSLAMARVGRLEDWLNATARADGQAGGSAVSFSSCFPFVDETRFVAPPRSFWPPTSPALLSARVRWKSARFVPLEVVEALFAGQALDETQWTVDGPSECLIPASATAGPFRTSVRWNAAVDRLSGVSERHSTACTEFRAGAGLWTLAAFADEAARDQWTEPVKAAFRWLADTGLGGEKSRGWGRAEAPEFKEGFLPDLVVPPAQKPAPAPLSEDASAAEGHAQPEQQPTPEPSPAAAPAPLSNGPRPHWLLSLFTPSEADAVDWSRGNYSLVSRSGRVDGSGELKKQLQMVAEGSVLFAPEAPRGAAPDVAPEGASHPVYRCGFAVAIPLPEVA